MKYEIYIKGEYAGMINQTLRVLEVSGEQERCKCALQYFIDQHPQNITIIPAGEHKKSKVVSLADIAPRLVGRKCKKPRTNTIAKGSPFLKIVSS